MGTLDGIIGYYHWMVFVHPNLESVVMHSSQGRCFSFLRIICMSHLMNKYELWTRFCHIWEKVRFLDKVLSFFLKTTGLRSSQGPRSCTGCTTFESKWPGKTIGHPTDTPGDTKTRGVKWSRELGTTLRIYVQIKWKRIITGQRQPIGNR